jgi:hypothetical protein
MISRWPGGGDETYVIYAIMAQTTGKEKIRFFIVPPSGGTPVFTYVPGSRQLYQQK